MDIGIVGLPNSGKTTVFNALTGAEAETAAFTGSGQEMNVAVVKVPDARLDYIVGKYKPPKTRFIELKYFDFAPVQKKSKGGGGFQDSHIADLRNCDALLLVVRAFADSSVPHPDGKIDPAADLDSLLTEFVLADLQVVENRLKRIKEGMHKYSKEERALLEKEKPVMERFRKLLEDGKFTAAVELSDEEEKLTRSYGLLTQKPFIVALNVDEKQLGGGIPETLRPVLATPAPILEMAGKMEMEISRLEPAEQKEFLADLGIEEPAAARAIRRTFDLLGLISFYTVAGKQEVGARSIKKGATAIDAAAKVHKDIARGFIRAEVVSFEDFAAFDGDMNKIKEAGKFRLEGKEYIIRDGDIVTIRFNV